MTKLVVIGVLLLFLGVFSFAVDQPSIGAKAPSFSLSSQDGSSISLDQFKGKWVVLYFYPKDFTTGCTMEAHNFQKDIDQYQQKNAVILGVSVDTVDSHKSFCTKEGLNFKLLSDHEQKVSIEYGSLMEWNGNKISARNTFLIDPDGVIRKVYLKVNPQNHSQEVLADLAQLEPGK